MLLLLGVHVVVVMTCVTIIRNRMFVWLLGVYCIVAAVAALLTSSLSLHQQVSGFIRSAHSKFLHSCQSPGAFLGPCEDWKKDG